MIKILIYNQYFFLGISGVVLTISVYLPYIRTNFQNSNIILVWERERYKEGEGFSLYI